MRRRRARHGNIPTLIVFAVALSAAQPLGAAITQEPQLVDRIVAVVGDSAVLESELKEYIFRLQTQGVRVPESVLGWATGQAGAAIGQQEFDEFLRQVLDQKINEVLLIIHAERDGVTLAESQINEVVDQRLAQIKRGFQSEAEFEMALQEAGITPAEYRIQLADQARAELMTQRFLQQKVSELQPAPVSEEEIRELFELQKASLGAKPATVSLKQVIFGSRPSADARLFAREKAEQALSRARSGEDFARLAREYSDDTATRDGGGELGWVGRGDLVPEFEDALFRLRPGEISDLVESPFGYHIIKLDRVRGLERFARHILTMPEITPQDEVLAQNLAGEVAAALRAGADPDSLIAAYSDPQERATLTGFPQDRLPEEYRQALQGARGGETVDPFEVVTPGLPQGKWVVIKVTALSPGGEWTLDDVRETLRLQIQQDKLLRRLVQGLRESTFIEVRLESTLAG